MICVRRMVGTRRRSFRWINSRSLNLCSLLGVSGGGLPASLENLFERSCLLALVCGCCTTESRKVLAERRFFHGGL